MCIVQVPYTSTYVQFEVSTVYYCTNVGDAPTTVHYCTHDSMYSVLFVLLGRYLQWVEDRTEKVSEYQRLHRTSYRPWSRGVWDSIVLKDLRSIPNDDTFFQLCLCCVGGVWQWGMRRMRMRMTDDSVAAATSAFGGYEERKTQVRTTILISELVFSFPRIYKNRAGYGYSFFCIISVLTSDILSLLVPFVVPTCQRLVHNVPLDPSTTVTTTRILAWNVLVGATLIITTNVLSMTMTVMTKVRI
jgi:hypothetical protein